MRDGTLFILSRMPNRRDILIADGSIPYAQAGQEDSPLHKASRSVTDSALMRDSQCPRARLRYTSAISGWHF